jgi:hypothetical protein
MGPLQEYHLKIVKDLRQKHITTRLGEKHHKTTHKKEVNPFPMNCLTTPPCGIQCNIFPLSLRVYSIILLGTFAHTTTKQSVNHPLRWSVACRS